MRRSRDGFHSHRVWLAVAALAVAALAAALPAIQAPARASASRRSEVSPAEAPTLASNPNATDPATVGQWSSVILLPNVAIHMNLMSNGDILTWDDETTVSGSSYVWHVADNTFNPVAYNPANLFCSGHTELADGRVLVNGGHLSSYVGINGSVLFTPSTGTWQAAANMAYARWYPSTTILPDGRVITVSGAIDCPETCREPGSPDPGVALIPEVYDPESNTWTALSAASKYFPLYPHLFVLPDGRVIATSSQEDPFPTVALDVNTQTWSTIDPATVDGGCSVMYLPGKFLKSGMARNTAYSTAAAIAQAHVLDMTAPSPAWRAVGPMAFPRTQHNMTILPDGSVLVTGGGRTSDRYDEPNAVLEAELWSPTTETFTTMAAMVTPRLYHSTALLLPDARVATGGGGRPGPDHPDAEIFSPPYLFKGPRPTITSAPSTVEYATTFTVVTPDAASIAGVSLIRLGSVTHAYNSDQRFVPLSFTAGSGSLTVQAPTSGNIAPPGHYMLFIVNTAGVPSVAPILRFPSPAEDIQPPTAPSALVATSSVGTIALTWTAASDNVGVAAYEIHRSLAAGFTPNPSTQVGLSGTTGYDDTEITAAVTYYYRVVARDARGNTGPPSNQASEVGQPDTTPPAKPTGLTGSPVSWFRIDLTWNPSSDDVGVTGYRLRRAGAVIGTATSPYFSNTGLQPSTTYTYSAEAYDAAGNTSALADSVFVTTPDAPSTAVGRMAAYAFDEGSGTTTADYSGNNHTGTLTNGPAWVPGKYGGALSFNATDDGNDANDPRVVLGPNVNIPSLPITVSAWVNPAGYADWRAILSKRSGSAPANRRFDMGLSAGSGAVYVATGATLRQFSYTPPTGAWTHLAVVATGGGTSLYVNGVFHSTIAAVVLGSATSANTVIGGTGEGPLGDNDPFKGLIDDVRINDRALTASEIQSDMNTSVSGAVTGVDPMPPAPTAVLHVFPNPFRTEAKIVALGGEAVEIYGADGRLRRRWHATGGSDVRRLDWDGRDDRGRRLPAGIYFVRAGGRVVRVALLR